MSWDLFCRVVDNYGDIGIAWRLAADLAARGERVRLWVDDPSALAWMAPDGAPGVEVGPWPDAVPADGPADIVIEAFGCEPPAPFVVAMAQCRPAPIWINLEYLSAQAYVERLHGLRSPQLAGPGAGLDKWFFFPGFTPAAGGLLREPDLISRQAAFDRRQWLDHQGCLPRAGERVVALFCYDNPRLPELLAALASAPTLLLACPGPAQRGLANLPAPAGVRVVQLPWLTQRDFDHLLWSADLAFVRGEDSFVRAQWAGQPFVWQIYPQRDGAHEAKLAAFLDLFDRHAAPADPARLRALWQAWNGLGPWPDEMPEPTAWRDACRRWRGGLLAQADLGTRLLNFIAERR